MKLPFWLIAFLLPLGLAAKLPSSNEKLLKAYQDSLCKMDSTIFNGTDDDKMRANRKFLEVLKKALNTDGAFDYAFDSIKTIGILNAPDNTFRIFNWDMPKDDGTYFYFGLLMVNDSKVKNKKGKNTYTIYELEDKSADIKNPEGSVLSPEKWFGALYYRIVKTNDKKDSYYTLLGWDGNTPMTWKKVIDVLSFGRDGRPVFGAKRLFQRGARRMTYNRVIFEFRADLVMALRYEDDNKRIVFDHLAPEVDGAEGMYQFYSQTFQYDAFIWKKGKWVEVDDVSVNNDATPNDKKWINPKDSKRPAENGQAPNPNGPPAKHGRIYRYIHRHDPTSGAG